MEGITKRLALFESGYGTVFAGEGDSSKEYTRVSQHIEVTFPPIPQDELVRNRIAGIDESINDHFEQIEKLRQRKQELLALEHIEP